MRDGPIGGRRLSPIAASALTRTPAKLGRARVIARPPVACAITRRHGRPTGKRRGGFGWVMALTRSPACHQAPLRDVLGSPAPRKLPRRPPRHRRLVRPRFEGNRLHHRPRGPINQQEEAGHERHGHRRREQDVALHRTSKSCAFPTRPSDQGLCVPGAFSSGPRPASLVRPGRMCRANRDGSPSADRIRCQISTSDGETLQDPEWQRPERARGA